LSAGPGQRDRDNGEDGARAASPSARPMPSAARRASRRLTGRAISRAVLPAVVPGCRPDSSDVASATSTSPLVGRGSTGRRRADARHAGRPRPRAAIGPGRACRFRGCEPTTCEPRRLTVPGRSARRRGRRRLARCGLLLRPRYPPGYGRPRDTGRSRSNSRSTMSAPTKPGSASPSPTTPCSALGRFQPGHGW
jgi:hypothetical protein